MDVLIFAAGFAVVALASKQIGGLFLKANLPLISGFLFTGIIAGPYVLDLIPLEATKNLRFVDELSLAFIAFAAGSELYLKELRSRFKSIRWVTFGNVVIIPILGSMTLFLLSNHIPFMRSMTPANRFAVAILAGAILVARSPSSAIAIVNELRAKGPFTQTTLGVTMVSDVVVIILFALSSSVADTLLTKNSLNLSLIALLATELTISLIAGYALGKIIQLILSLPIHRPLKTFVLLTAGYGVFALSNAIRHVSQENLPFELLLEPLLICMIGSFVATNFSKDRRELLRILHEAGPPIYIAFFTLTGASLDLDVLPATWQIALALFLVRLVAIFIGSFVGGALGGDPMSHNRISWMSYITQAGVGLGLAKETVVEFPEWGTAFATIIIAVIVVNQIVGPPFFKWAIHLAGEAHTRAKTPDFDGVQDVIIFGLESESMALARQLQTHGWEVRIAALDMHYAKEISNDSAIEIHPIPNLNMETLHKLDAGKAEAIVAMLSDEENYKICELAYENFGTDNLVVRLNDRFNFKKFHKLGALIVDPATAIVSLLDHLVRSPAAASLLLGMEKGQDVIEMEVRNPDLHGMSIRDLRLPLDVHILSVRRGGHMLISHGYTRLELGDLISVVGSVESLEQIALHFDTNREYETLQLVERVTPSELAGRSLEREVKEIIREPQDPLRQRFFELIEESDVIDIPYAVEIEEFMQLAARKLSARLNKKPEEIFELLMEREKEASTAITAGLAIPHIIVDGEHSFSILLARCRDGIHFSERAPMVNAVFVLVGTLDERNFHLRALSTIAEIVRTPQFEKRWMRAKNENALRDTVLLGMKKPGS
ncbi:MAG: cation:proton antiporter [bacterium]